MLRLAREKEELRVIDDQIVLSWVQDNQSKFEKEYTLRGLHLQRAPFAQAKLVRVLSGSVFDVAFDLRSHSQTYRRRDDTDLGIN